jgi:pectin methylesterase-like acyl-CoA thioesterase
MQVLRTLKNLNKQFALALVFTLLFQSVAAAASLVNDTFADANSQNQSLASDSVRIFNGRAATVRSDAAGSVNFNLAAVTSSEGFWGFFTDGAPVTLGVGDRLAVTAKFSVQGIHATNNAADMRFGLFDSKLTRTTANTTGGLNSPTFTDDTGYGTRLAGTAASGTPPFTVHRRTTPSATDPLSNIISTTVAEWSAVTVTGGSPRAALVNGMPYTFTFTVERVSAADTRITVRLTDGASLNLSSTATETSQTPATTFDWFGFRVPTGFASDVKFTQWSADYTPAAPVITAQPQPSNLTVQVGSQITMSVAASGNQLSYRWHKNGAPVAGNASAATQTLTITNAQVADTGVYTAVVSNAGGSTTSTPVQLTVSEGEVAPPPTISAQPADTTVVNGSPASLSVVAEGEGLFYQWYKNGTLIPGATAQTLNFSAASVADTASYTVVVGNSGGNVTSSAARLLVVSAMTATGFGPAPGAGGVNPDAQLKVTFDREPKVGTYGKVRVYNAADNSLVDTVDLGVDTNTGVHAPGPQSARPIGGSSWQFNYHPVIVEGNAATIYTKVRLAYGQTYYVTMEPGVLTDAAGAPFVGVGDQTAWQFSTKPEGPAAGTTALTVAADGTGDFDTVQGAVDFVPANNAQPVTINVRKGRYTEIVYVRSNKRFITVKGEDRNESVIQYANNENLNTGSSPRAAFGVDAPDFTLENVTVVNTTTRFNSENRTRQSEAFRGNNDRILLNRVNLKSFQDTLLLQSQSNQGGFVNESYIEGDIDFLWGTGAVYFRNTEVKMVNSNAYYTQIRNGAGKNGYVFVNSRFTAAPNVTGAYLTRIDPDQFPYSQVVLIDSVLGPHVRPDAWRLDDNARDGYLAPLTQAGYPNVRFWEFNSREEGGNPIDVSQRHPISRQITADEADFWRNPANVLGGWTPELGTSTVSLAGLNQTYTGQPVAASVITEPANLAVQVTYNGSTQAPVAPGSYEVVATITQPGYRGTATGTLVIEKAQAVVTVESASYSYDGTAKAVNVTTDPAGLGVEVTYNGSNAAPTQAGAYAVTATVVDANYKGTAAGTLTITEAANTAPVLTLPADITLEATSAQGAAATFAATASDNEDGQLTVTLSHQSGSTFPLGTTNVTASAADANGSRAEGSFNVTVRDTTAPSLNVPGDMTLDATSDAGAVATFTAEASDAVSGNVPVEFTVASGSTFPVGTTAVTAIATDAAGNAATGTFNVTVRDTTAPTVSVPADLTLEATGPDGATANFTASATDNVGGQLPVTYSSQPGGKFALGTTTVTVTATDAAGNTGTGAFKVTVVDTTVPSLNVPADLTLEATGPEGATVNFAAEASDAVSGTLPVGYSQQPGTKFALGVTTVTATAKDAAGNTATRTFSVTVVDTTAPVIQSLTASPATITQNNGKMVPVTITATVADAVDSTPATRIISVTGSENIDGDWQITGDLTLQVRAKRSGKTGRVYTITVESRDDAGNASTRNVTVTVR